LALIKSLPACTVMEENWNFCALRAAGCFGHSQNNFIKFKNVHLHVQCNINVAHGSVHLWNWICQFAYIVGPSSVPNI
jgi:hypothetical protein